MLHLYAYVLPKVVCG